MRAEWTAREVACIVLLSGNHGQIPRLPAEKYRLNAVEKEVSGLFEVIMLQVCVLLFCPHLSVHESPRIAGG